MLTSGKTNILTILCGRNFPKEERALTGEGHWVWACFLVPFQQGHHPDKKSHKMETVLRGLGNGGRGHTQARRLMSQKSRGTTFCKRASIPDDVFVSWGCLNKVSQTLWSKHKKCILSQSWRPEIQSPGVYKLAAFGAVRKNLLHAPLLTSGDLLASSIIPWRSMHHSNVRPCF